MDNYFVCILLCIVQRLLVNGQMLVSHKDGVIVTSSSQHVPYEIWDISHVVDSTVEYDLYICHCCGATNNDASPWFKLDLGEEYNIQRIHVIGRQHSYHSLYKMEIQLGTTEADGTVLQGLDTSDTDLRELNYTLTSPKLARFITLTLRDFKQYFVICELYVYAVCTEGTYGPDCVKTCGKCQNNETCDGVTGACSECLTGYHFPLCQDCIDGRYGSTCNEECGNCIINDVCDKSSGDCPSVCSVGYQGTNCKGVCRWGTYGLDCAYTCGTCENNATCNNVDGTCTACATGYLSSMCKDCIDGRYGSTCNEECGNCNNNDVCDKSSGDCPSACSVGYQGTNCKGVCSWGTYGLGCAYTCGRCENNASCNNVDGTCTACAIGYLSSMCKDCIDGRYGSTCNEECGNCNNNDVCNKSSGDCPGACSVGYQGTNCKGVCIWETYGLGCAYTCGRCEKNATCNNVDGTCTACATGYLSPMCKDCSDGRYGSTCNEECGNCNNNDVCNKSSGDCPSACSAGYQGTNCKEVCSWGTYGLGCAYTCGRCENNASCNNVDGTCTACATGYLSPMCKDCIDGRYGSTCKEECGNCNNSDVCDISSGDCPSACSAGYQGTNCKQECEDGTYGLDCQETCGNCFNNEPCNKMHGDCVTCAAGFQGNTCVDECQSGTFSFNCIQYCGKCLDEDVCDIYTGDCPRGCTDGYKGSQCSQEMNEDTSPCSDNTFISIPVFIGSLFAVIVINTTSGFLWLLYRNRLHRKTHKAANNADTPIHLPNTPSIYDTLKFDNPDEESRYIELNRRF